MSAPDRLTCEEMFRRLEDYVDRELSADEVNRVEDHLKNCTTCLAEYTFENNVVQSVRDKLQHIDVPSDLFRSVKKYLRGASDEPPS